MLERIVPFSEEQIHPASEFLGRAFYNDPLAAYFLPDPEERAELLPRHFEILVRYGLLAEKVWTTENLGGLIVCQPPGHVELEGDAMRKSGMLDEGKVVGEDAWKRFIGVAGKMEPLRLRDAGSNHWYVMMLGVNPSKQGTGVGSTLLGHVSALADRDRVPIYLETGEPGNVPFYTKNGFEAVVEDVEPESKLRYWTFRRGPK